MAEGLARKELQGLADVESAGTHAWSGSASTVAIAVMRSRFGIDISSHRSRNVRDLKLEDFDRIIAMDSSVAESLMSAYPIVRSRLISWEIIDPVGKGFEAYERSARQILEHIRELHL
jgi:protein-tyrosine phosphatase